VPECTSRAIARAIAIPVAAAKPCTNRAATSSSIVQAVAHSTEATTYPERPASSGMRLPRRSLTGPTSSWPSARPTSVVASVACTAPAEVRNSCWIAGNAGV
jgi:hypothetical protein